MSAEAGDGAQEAWKLVEILIDQNNALLELCIKLSTLSFPAPHFDILATKSNSIIGSWA